MDGNVKRNSSALLTMLASGVMKKRFALLAVLLLAPAGAQQTTTQSQKLPSDLRARSSATPARFSSLNRISVTSASLNHVLNPTACSGSNAPSWCSGTTLDQWIMATIKGPCGAGPDLTSYPVCTLEIPPGNWTWSGTVTIPPATTTEQANFGLIFDRGAIATVSSSLVGDAIVILPSIYEGEHALLKDVHLVGGGSSTTAAVHNEVYSTSIIHPIISGFSSGAGIWNEGGGADIEYPSIASAKYCIELSSTSAQQPNATHVYGGEFDSCNYGWYHNDPVPGLVHIGQGNSIQNTLMEAVGTPILDTASQNLVAIGLYAEYYNGSPVQLGSTQNATFSPLFINNQFHTTNATTYSLNNVFGGTFGGIDSGTPTAFWTLTGGASNNQIVGYFENVTVVAGTALGSGGRAACDTADGFQCTWKSGVVTIVAGSGAGAGIAFQISWTTPFANNPVCTAQTITAALSITQDGTFLQKNAVKFHTGDTPSGTQKIAYTCPN